MHELAREILGEGWSEERVSEDCIAFVRGNFRIVIGSAEKPARVRQRCADALRDDPWSPQLFSCAGCHALVTPRKSQQVDGVRLCVDCAP